MNRKIKFLNITAVALLVMQLLAYGYLGSDDVPEEGGVSSFFFYFGFNMFVIIALLLSYVSYRTGRKLKRKEQDDLVEAIGNNDSAI